ncbi:MAG: hypothetical protein QXJ96_02225 [Candidatus Aenigmatarchaeota archaeon]|nr:hypothetical protein [Candidatus Aenigmarchaeota archaeon]
MRKNFFIFLFAMFFLSFAFIKIVISQSIDEKIKCEKNVTFVGENIICEAKECRKGVWFISNKIGEPIKNIVTVDIPPNKIVLPTTEEGLVSLNVICFEPSDYYGKEIQVIKGVDLLCNNFCRILKPCTCVAINCTKGVLSISSYNGTPLEKDITKLVSVSPFEFNFNATGTGTILARLDCFEPVILSRANKIEIAKSCIGNISLELRPELLIESNKTYTLSLMIAKPSGVVNCENKTIYIRRGSCNGIIECNTTQDVPCTFYTPSEPRTYEYYACIDKNDDNDFLDEGESFGVNIQVIERPQEIKIENIECTSNICKFNITKNTINESLTIIIYLFEEPSGKIYFSSLLSLDKFSIGEKRVFLSPPPEVANCSRGTQLTALFHVYKSEKFGERIFRTKKSAFIC